MSSNEDRSTFVEPLPTARTLGRSRSISSTVGLTSMRVMSITNRRRRSTSSARRPRSRGC
jgi:hypothetical protein